MTTIPFK